LRALPERNEIHADTLRHPRDRRQSNHYVQVDAAQTGPLVEETQRKGNDLPAIGHAEGERRGKRGPYSQAEVAQKSAQNCLMLFSSEKESSRFVPFCSISFRFAT
jgi:hypothetical protein